MNDVVQNITLVVADDIAGANGFRTTQEILLVGICLRGGAVTDKNQDFLLGAIVMRCRYQRVSNGQAAVPGIFRQVSSESMSSIC